MSTGIQNCSVIRFAPEQRTYHGASRITLKDFGKLSSIVLPYAQVKDEPMLQLRSLYTEIPSILGE